MKHRIELVIETDSDGDADFLTDQLFEVMEDQLTFDGRYKISRTTNEQVAPDD